MKKKHILFIVENNSVPHDRRVWAEAQAAKEFGYDVSVICPIDERLQKKYLNIEGIDIYCHSRTEERPDKIGMILEYMNALFWEFILSFKLFFKKRFHVIHAANPPDHIFLIALIFKLFGVKYIFDHHDISPENYVAKYGGKGIFYYILLGMEWLTFRTANLVICTNESYKKIALSRGNKDEENIFVVRNGPNIDKIPLKKPNNKLREGFKYLVGYVGVIGQQEGIENLLDAIKYLVTDKKITDVKFIVVGSGPYWNEIVKIAQAMNVEKYIRFTGYIPDEELYEVLNTADVCINPEFSNPFTDKSTMVKIMEYMTFGKPVVQFETTEGKISAGDASIYVKNNSPKEFADALIDLIQDEEKRQRMGKIGRKKIEEQLGWHIQKLYLQKAYTRIFSKNIAQ